MDLRRVTFISSVDLYRGLPAQCEVWHEDAYLPPLSFSDVGNKKRAAEQIRPPLRKDLRIERGKRQSGPQLRAGV